MMTIIQKKITQKTNIVRTYLNFKAQLFLNKHARRANNFSIYDVKKTTSLAFLTTCYLVFFIPSMIILEIQQSHGMKKTEFTYKIAHASELLNSLASQT